MIMLKVLGDEGNLNFNILEFLKMLKLVMNFCDFFEIELKIW